MTNIQERRSEVQRILNHLESTLVPESGLDLFTVGDGFFHLVSELEADLLDLTSQMIYREFIIEAQFGGGKTHFIKYLSNLVAEAGQNNVVVSSIDMSRVASSEEFELLLVRGMRSSIEQAEGQILRESYDRVIQKLADSYLKNQINASSSDLAKVFETLLYFVIGKVSLGFLDDSVIKLLGGVNPVAAFVNAITGKTVNSLTTQARQNSSASATGFVDAYLSIVRERNAPLTKFNEACNMLSKEGELTNVIFRILKLAGYDSMVLFVDELETVSQHSDDVGRRLLTGIRDFRDKFNRVGEIQGYPSTAFVVASTSQFAREKLILLDPALYSRWRRKFRPLEPLTESDIDHLIFRLRDMFYLGGFKLKKLEDGDIHEIIVMRRRLLGERITRKEDRTPRDVISELITLIRREWVIK